MSRAEVAEVALDRAAEAADDLRKVEAELGRLPPGLDFEVRRRRLESWLDWDGSRETDWLVIAAVVLHHPDLRAAEESLALAVRVEFQAYALQKLAECWQGPTPIPPPTEGTA